MRYFGAAALLGIITALVGVTAEAAGASSPSFLQACTTTPGTIDNSGGCIGAVLDAIDQARAAEGIGPMTLPGSYPAMAPEAQLLAIVNRERADRGLATLAGTTGDLDSVAQGGADTLTDPAVSAPPYADGRWQGTSTEANALTQALGADYYWMYQDGWGGSQSATFNIDCTSATAPGCWSHRRALLVAFDPGLTLSMGAAVNPTAAQGYPVWTTLLMGTTGHPPAYTATATPVSACDSGIPTGKVARVAGADRDATAILASADAFPQNSSAGGVVLASDANFPDALTGGPLAVDKHAPLLINPPAGLAPAVDAEIHRVLAPGGTVYVLGGPLAMSPSVDHALAGAGFAVQRLAGADRYQTAVAIAHARNDPATVIEVTGTGFADALAAAPAATAADAALLLTDGATQAGATAGYLAQHSGARYSVGGPAGTADPAASPIAGPDRYATALAVAERFFTHPATLGFATGATFPDALAGGPVAARQGGALLLVPSCGTIPADVSAFLSSVGQSVTSGWLFGGGTAVGDQILGQLNRALG